MLKTDDDCYVRASKLMNLVKKLGRDGEGMMYVGRQVLELGIIQRSSHHAAYMAG